MLINARIDEEMEITEERAESERHDQESAQGNSRNDESQQGQEMCTNKPEERTASRKSKENYQVQNIPHLGNAGLERQCMDVGSNEEHSKLKNQVASANASSTYCMTPFCIIVFDF